MDEESIWERMCSPFVLEICDMRMRHLGSDDVVLLPALAYAAFAGTVDEAPPERWTRKISAIVSNGYGRFLEDASFVAETHSGQLAGVVLVTDFALYGDPVIAMIAVSPPLSTRVWDPFFFATVSVP